MSMRQRKHEYELTIAQIKAQMRYRLKTWADFGNGPVGAAFQQLLDAASLIERPTPTENIQQHIDDLWGISFQLSQLETYARRLQQQASKRAMVTEKETGVRGSYIQEGQGE